MARLSFKTVCKGTALLFFVILLGLNAETTIAPATTSSPSAELQTSASQKPDVIRDLLVSEITTSSVFLKWEESTGYRSFFKIQWTDDKTNATTNTSSYLITGLTSGVNYTFCITAVAADQSTESESVCISAWTKPDMINNLKVTEITTSSVFLTWDERFGNISFFKLNWTDEKTSNHVTTNNTWYNITDLTAGVNYTFIITAVAADKSTEGYLHYGPDVIKDLLVSEITTSSVFLKWEESTGYRSFFKIQWTDDKTNATTNTSSYLITGLTSGVNYTFCITAVAADQSTESESVCISAWTKPDIIMNLTADDITSSSVLLNWIKPYGQSSRYRVEYENKNVSTENTSIKLNDLIPGAQYTFRVFAVAADHVTEGRANQISLYTKPNVIKNLRVSEITTSSVFLTWDEPAGNRSFFKLNWTDQKFDLIRNAIATTNTFYNITGLTSGVNYTLIITAVAADKSTEGGSVATSNYTKPDIIMILTADDITASSVLLNWTKPYGQSSRYHVEYENSNLTTENTSIKIDHLIPGAQYTFKVFAVAADHVTEGRANQMSLHTKPDIIMNLTADDITASSVLLNWTKPYGQSSCYRVEYENNNVTTENTSIKIDHLTPGAQYTFRVFAVAADHVTEGRANQISLHTKPALIRDLLVSEITTSCVFLTWEEPTGSRSFFKIQWTDDKTTATTNTSSYLITGLTSGVSYTFCITAVAADQSTESESVCISAWTKPDMIKNLKVTEITTSSVFLTWDEPFGNISFLKLNWTDEKTSNHVTTNNTWYNITDLTAGVNYTFIITAVAADKSTEGEAVVTSKYTKPDIIMNLTADDITASSVLLNWTKPYGQSSRYRVEYENNNATTENTSIKIYHLTPGAQYTFRVFAVAADHVTKGRDNQISLYTKPDMIKNLKVTEITTSSVFLTWDEPFGNISFLKLNWTDEKTSNHVTTNNTWYNITDLTAGVNYTFIITAVATDKSTEGESVVTSKYTKPDIIMNLTADDITASSVLLNWTKPYGQSSCYHVEYENNNVTTENTSIKIDHLTPGAKYTFRVFAVATDHVTKGRANNISLYTKPDVIKNLRVSEIRTSSVFLTWDEPFGNRSFFKLNWTDQKFDLIRNAIETTNTSSYLISGLTSGVNYTFCITAVAADKSTESESVCISAWTKPDMIKNLKVTEITTSSVFLTWDEPFGNRSLFKLNWTDEKTSNHVTTNKTWYNITDLTAGVNYTFIITAVAADKSTEGESVVTSKYTKPDIIMNLTSDHITSSSVLLNWTKPYGQSSCYRVEYENNNVTTENTSIKIDHLTPGAKYTFRVFAVAADHVTEGRGNQISLYTKPDVIKNLKVTKITTSSVFLTWDEPFGNRSLFKLNWTDEKTSNHVTTNNTWYNITDLTAGVNYTFIITAVAADKSTEGESVVTSKYTKPDIIMNLTADDITASSVLLNWIKPYGQSSCYRVEYENNNATTENTSIKIDHLTPGAQYKFRVFAVATDHVTEGRANQISLYTKPNVIKNLRVSEITTSSVFLTWDEPFGNRSFFKIQWTGDQINGYSATINTYYNITRLTAGVNYTLCITALTAHNVDESEPFCICKYTEPDVIKYLRVSEITTSSVFLTWDEPAGNRSFFKLNWTDEKTSNHVTTNNTWYNITDLTAGVNYTFIITAVAADKSTEGESVVTSKYTKPDIIMNLTADDITASSVLLNWIKPYGQSSCYRVEYENNNATTENTSIKIDHLTPGAQYKFRVFAVATDHVTEGRANQISLYTKPNVIKNLRVSEITTSSVFLTWDEPFGNRSFFKIQWTGDQINGYSATINTYYNITRLTAGVNYTLCITALTAHNVDESEPFCICKYTEPDVIKYLRVSEITTSSVFLTWDEPAGNRSFFKLNWTDEKTSNHVTTNNTWYNITDLTAGVNYTFIITAVAADKSTEGEAVVTSKHTKPDIIMNLTADDITASSVLLNWTKPYGQSSCYHVEYENNNVTTENTSIKIDHLTPGAQYTFRVFAVAADHVTEGRANQISLYTKPDVIRNLRVSEITTTSVFLTWDEPAGNIYFFKLQWTDEKTSATTNTSSYLISGLTAGVSYTFCITAVAADRSTEGETFCISQYTKLDIWLIVGVALAAICFLFIIILILFFYSRRKAKEQYPDIPLHIFSNTAMRIVDYEEQFKRKQADGFAEEFEKLKAIGMAQSKNAAQAIENKEKNRDGSVLPYDASRVKLSKCGSPFDDYINASYVPGYKSREEFIAAQCPLPTTVDEFWRMIWEKNVYTIVMLNKRNEKVMKCEKYWPSGTYNYHNISVTTTSETDLESWIIRDFRIKNVKTEETRNICQFHFTAWPDHEIPASTEVLIDFRCLVRKHMDQYSRHSPAVVHCSSGMATGVFIAIDHLIFQIERDSMVDVYGIVTDMQMHRPLMIQTEAHYSYLHQCAYDIIRSRTGTNMDLIYQNTEAPQIYEKIQHI
ncbi:tenascin-X isoform X2 [Carassius auratus]|uniref:protein-tyrosine-phosphatase n=1 Tax=Carassius auratus TaxID=7957 RepID=A0A6P6MGN6_CARAU|nr:tenascin-X-like isoform X2 [Carassius auratus]